MTLLVNIKGREAKTENKNQKKKKKQEGEEGESKDERTGEKKTVIEKGTRARLQ